MDFFNQFGIVIAVLGLLVLLLAWLKMRGHLAVAGFRAGASGARVRDLKVLDKVMISAQHVVVLLEVKDTRVLVCFSPSGAQTTILEER